MGKVVEKKKKKKGRPSLLDLQKRSLRQQQKQQQQNQLKQNPYSNNFRNPNPNPNPNPDPNRRFTRQNPVSEGVTNEEGEAEDEEDDDLNGKRRKKKLKLVLRLPPSRLSNPSSSPPSQHLRNSGSCGSDSNEEDENGETPLKKRKIDAVFDRSAPSDEDLNAGSAKEKAERQNSSSKGTDPLPGMPSESTPLPDKKLLVFILDRLQKKDTYAVFSEPVDPKELPDYHEVIEHPMDFSTVRKKLNSGAYADLEQFEKDVFLICSNAMRYNAPDTIYFRQARSILELAKKDFENLRQDSEDNEPEPRSVRRGRPPKNSIKKSFGRSADLAASDFSSDATLATGGDNTIWPNSSHDLLRKATGSDKPSIMDASTRGSHGSRNTETHSSLLNDEFPGSTLKGMSMKYGKKPFVFDENRRSTYKQSNQSVSGREPSVLATFDGERKQLTTVGLHMEHSYARSLARFAANLGPTAWKIASKKIERVLPPGTKFGPGWVGEYEAPPQPPLLLLSSPQPPQLESQNLPSQTKAASFTTTPRTLEVKGDKLSEKQESQGQPSTTLHPSTSASVSNRSSDPTEGGEAVRGLNYGSVFGLLNSGSGIRPNPPFQFHQNPAIHSTVNGFNGGFGFNLQSHGGKSVGPARPPGNFGSSMAANRLETENANMLVSSSLINSGNSLPDSGREGQTGLGTGLHPHSSRRGLSLHPKQDSVPPDLNVRFQSPGSPVSGVMVDSQQPDLALQL